MTVSTSLQSRPGTPKPRTLGELRHIPDFDAARTSISVKNELRRNLLRAIEKKEPLFPGVHGYEDTVIPQIVNALLSRHNFILLGLRGQAKSRILRGLAQLLDAEIPVVAGCEINDNPLNPICRACRERIAAEGDGATPSAITGFAVAEQYVFTFSVTPPRIRVWTLDGQHKLDDTLGGRLDGVAAPQIAVTPGAELLVLDPASPRVYRFRLHL